MTRNSNTASQIAKLKKQLELLQKKESAVKSKQQERALSQIVKLARENLITAKDIEAALKRGVSKKRVTAQKTTSKKSSLKGKPVAPKYRNPQNAEQTWTGRGIAPTWIQALKTEGKLETALIGSTTPQNH